MQSSVAQIVFACPDGTKSSTCDSEMKARISASATDKDGDSLLYTYSVTGGRIAGEGPSAVWDLSSVQSGTYTATVEVDDGCGCIAFASTTVTAEECTSCK